MKMKRIYACKGGACTWHGCIDDMVTVRCPLCGGGFLKYIGDSPTEEEDEDAGRTIFTRRRTRDREAEVDEKSEKKRPGLFERVGKKLYFRRS